MFRILSIVCFTGLLQQLSLAQTTQPTNDTATLYLQAANLMHLNNDQNIYPPSASNLVYADYPPFPAAWEAMEKSDFMANAPARALAHLARSAQTVNWHPVNLAVGDFSYLNRCRWLGADLGDAAMYQHLQGSDADAIEKLRDEWHLADVLEDQSDNTLTCMLSAYAVRSQCLSHLEVVSSSVALTKDPADNKDLQTSVARGLIVQLLKYRDAQHEVKSYPSAGAQVDATAVDLIIRANFESGLAAMSLACHLYRFDTGKWPDSLSDFLNYFPVAPIDPYGDGKQTLGYVLIKGGLPDGSDRPMVYSQSQMKDGLFFRIDQPEYKYYGDGSNLPLEKQKHGGQFRDVASWAPTPGNHMGPTTRPLE